jgi:hypothetical protein
MIETDELLREFNHRVNNNFQIVVSLMNLKKRQLPAALQDDIRFIEEHVQSMAVAYRLIYASGRLLEVSARDLITEVVLGLRLIAKLAPERLSLDVVALTQMLNLDQAIALGLYLAAALPPYLDQARHGDGQVVVMASSIAEHLSLTISGDWHNPVPMDVLRERLLVAYVTQLGARQEFSDVASRHKISFSIAPLQTP